MTNIIDPDLTPLFIDEADVAYPRNSERNLEDAISEWSTLNELHLVARKDRLSGCATDKL